MNIEEKINLIGNNFRGLWLSRELVNGKIELPIWSVTFLYQEEIVETSACETSHEALDIAIRYLGI